MFIPSVFGGYNYSITDKLIFNSCLRFGYAKIKPTLKSINFTTVDPLDSNNPIIQTSNGLRSIKEINNSVDTELFLSEISPEFTYLINNWFGVSLNLGGVGYSLNDWDKEKSSWIINFHPQYWKLGFKIVI